MHRSTDTTLATVAALEQREYRTVSGECQRLRAEARAACGKVAQARLAEADAMYAAYRARTQR